MADNIKASSRSVAGVPTRLEVNTDTGGATLYGDEGIFNAFGRTSIATSQPGSPNKWTINDAFVKKYNNSNGTKLTKSQLQSVFAKKYTPTLNNDRANIINKHSPDDTKTYLKNTAKIPGVVDPKTGTKDGETKETPTEAKTDPNKDSSVTSPADTSPADLNTNQKSNSNIPGQTAPLRYPLDIAQTTQDVVKFDMLEFSPKPLTKSGGFGQGERKSTSERIIATSILSIPGDIKDTNASGWGDGSLNALEAAAANIALGGIMDGGTGLQASISQTIANVTGSSNDVKTGIANAFAGSAAGIGQQLLTRTTGAILNPNLELLFKGPTLRPFDFSFLLAPRDPAESREVINIIRFFKQGMAPIRSQSNLFLKSPNTFKITYLHRGESGQDHFALNKIKECALLALNVNYTPNSTYATFTDGSMVAYQVTMKFQELEPVYNDEYSSQQNTIGF
jgi:hypothetical protein